MALQKITDQNSLAFWKQLYNQIVDYVTPNSGSSIFRLSGAPGNAPYAGPTGKIDNTWLTADTANAANTIMLRDGNGRSQVTDPAAAQDAASKNYVDGLVSGSQVVMYSSRNLQGSPGATPTTQYNITAENIVVRNPSYAGKVISSFNRTVTIGGGLGLDGQDQAATFTPSSFVYIYAISDGTNSRLVASARSSDLGPDLSTGTFIGYTYWAFLTVLKLDASSHFINSRTRNNRVFYDAETILTGTGASTTGATYSDATLVPSTAASALFHYRQQSNNTIATWNWTIAYSSTSGVFLNSGTLDRTGFSGGSDADTTDAIFEMPNVSNNIYIVATHSYSLYVKGYVISNGAA